VAVSVVLGFWGVAALLIIVPGPDWAFVVSSGLRGHVVPAATGIVLGYLAMTAVVTAGVGALVAASPVALTVLTVGGGMYLLWLGAITLAHPAASAGTETSPAGRTATIVRGIGVSGLNPKGLLMFVAVLPQFTSRSAAWPIAAQMATLGLVFTITCAATYLAVGASAHRILHARPRTAQAVSRISGICMVLIGAGLLVEHLTA